MEYYRNSIKFYGLSQYRQTRTIEDNSSVSTLKLLYYYHFWDYINRYGQQINFSESTEVYGMYLYGVKSGESTEKVKIQLTGFYDKKPNSTIYHSQLINISNALGWHYQDISSSSQILGKGDYYLLIDGSDLDTGDPSYYLGCNLISPTYPLFWEWEVHNFGGESTYQREPFLCKIVQK